MTPYGATHGDIDRAAPLHVLGGGEPTTRLRWGYVAAAVLALLAILFIVAHLLGGRMHSH